MNSMRIMIFIFVLFLVIEHFLKKYLIKTGLFLKEFPNIDKKIINRYKTFDKVLGWKPIPTLNHPDNTGSYIGINSGSFFSINEFGSRFFKNSFSSKYIATFGDSFCMCREVNDDCTFQYFLSQQTNSFVLNYGVGNYGLDQALLRFETTKLPPSVKHVIMAVTPWTIERIISVWKHYCEPGNLLAAKPRFVLENKKLKLIDNFIKDTSDFLNLKKYKDFLHNYDGNYCFFYQQLKTFPKTALGYLFSDPDAIKYILAVSKIKNIKLEEKNRKEAIGSFLKQSEPFLLKKFYQENQYLQSLYDKQKELLKNILKRFVESCVNNDKVPYLVFLPSYSHVEFIKQGNPLYRNIVNPICEGIGLKFIDGFNFWKTFDEDELKNCYIDTYGHHSEIGNKYIADLIYKTWFI